MATPFIQGVKWTQVSQISSIQVADSSTIGIVSISPFGPTQEVVNVYNESTAEQFGLLHPSNLLRQAIQHMQQQGAGAIMAINIFDPAIHTSTVTETHEITSRGFKLGGLMVSDLEISTQDTVPVPLVLNTDYTYDAATQKVTIINPSYTDGTVLDIEFVALNAAVVTDAQVIGTDTAGVRTGLQLLKEVQTKYQKVPRIIVAPKFSERNAVVNAMLTIAEELKGIAVIDINPSASVDEVLKGRNGQSSIVTNASTRNERAVLVYPAVVAYNSYTDSNMVFPYSSFFAGAMARTDQTEGYRRTPTNVELKNVVGQSTNITISVSGNPNAESNLLLGMGVVTFIPNEGSHYIWGSHNALFDNTDTDPLNFINNVRIADLVADTLTAASVPYIGKDATDARFGLEQMANNFISGLVAQNILKLGSEARYNAAESNIPAGVLAFDVKLVLPGGLVEIRYTATLQSYSGQDL